MKNIYKSILVAVAAPMMLTSCLDEVQASDILTKTQIDASENGATALLWAMPAMLNYVGTLPSSDMAYDYGYGSIMHIRDVMTEDMPVTASNYEWYSAWMENTGIGNYTTSSQLVWWYMNKLVLAANNSIEYFRNHPDAESATGYLGTSLAYRAAAYLDLARMYEFLENDAVSPVNSAGNNVLGLTVPIVTEETTAEEARNNPRVSHETMFEFILNDLNEAEEDLTGFSVPSKVFPDLAVVYGLKARLYMWNEDYNSAREYARKAITQHGGDSMILTESEWLDTSNGFNTTSVNSWMWGAEQNSDSESVQTKYYNWTSWNCNETTFGYNYYGTTTMINAATYNRMSDTDFRKLSYVAPEGSALSGQEKFVDDYFKTKLTEYCALKFRPASGAYSDYTVGAASAYPLMRIEEMYFIEAEAAAHVSAGYGSSLLTSFMKNYRDPNYKCTVSSPDDVIEEIIFQKRVELWGEGQSYFDIKRLNYSVTRNYDGTNFSGDRLINTNGRPAWMNFVMLRFEGDNNAAVTDWNNPDTDNCY
jgi:hypothetical protein